MEQTRNLFCMRKSIVAHFQSTTVSLLVNEFNVRRVFHGQVSLASVSHIFHEVMNGCKNLDSLKACFENVYI